MARLNTKTCRIASMITLTLGFFVVEVVVGHMANSLALVADSFHMLSDVVALIVGLVSVQLSKRGSSKNNTFGWARAEVIGAMVNGIFLVALCFTILIEAVERLVSRESIEDPYLLLYVGSVGLGINLIGLFLFHNHAHGHTHGGSSHSHKETKKDEYLVDYTEDECVKLEMGEGDVPSQSSDDSESQTTSLRNDSGTLEIELNKVRKTKSSKVHQLNMRGVFLHVLGDALGSLVVIISAGLTIIARKYMDPCKQHKEYLTNTLTPLSNYSMRHKDNISDDSNMAAKLLCQYSEPNWVQCIDPVLSIILVVIILSTSLPLVKHAGLILMQSVPNHITVCTVEEDLKQIPGIIGVHELHIWNLVGNKLVASVHINMATLDEYLRISSEVKEYFHNQGIHSITIQPEFTQICKPGRQCSLECGPDRHCHAHTCCGTVSRKPRDS